MPVYHSRGDMREDTCTADGSGLRGGVLAVTRAVAELVRQDAAAGGDVDRPRVYMSVRGPAMGTGAAEAEAVADALGGWSWRAMDNAWVVEADRYGVQVVVVIRDADPRLPPRMRP